MNYPSALTIVASLAALAACSATDSHPATPQGAPPVQEETDKEAPQEPAPAAALDATISSVQFLQDCPDPQPLSPALPSTTSAPARAPATPAVVAPGKRKSATPGYRRPCRQSTVQISFVGRRSTPTKIELGEMRLMSSEGQMLSTISSRLATRWQDNGYVTWDQVLPTEGELKAAYKISPPNWQAVEEKLGSGSYQKMFVLEIDVIADGVTTTLRSLPVNRQQEIAIPT